MSSTPIKGKRPVETENNTSPDKRKMKQPKKDAGASASGMGGGNKAAGKPPGAAAPKKQGGGAGAGAAPKAKAKPQVSGGSGSGAGAGAKPKAKGAAKPSAAAAVEDLGSEDSGADDDEFDGPTLEALQALDAAQERLLALDSKHQFAKMELARKCNAEKADDYVARAKVIREQIPGFWGTALLAHEGLRGLFQEYDSQALEALTDVVVTDLKAPELGYTISLHFDSAKNKLFSNAKLEKTYRFVKLSAADKAARAKAAAEEDDSGAGAAPAISEFDVKVTSTGVTFRDAKGADEKYMESFFNQWFDPEAAAEDNSEDAVAEMFRSEIWPNPVMLYLDAIGDGVDGFDDDDDDGLLDADDDDGADDAADN